MSARHAILSDDVARLRPLAVTPSASLSSDDRAALGRILDAASGADDIAVMLHEIAARGPGSAAVVASVAVEASAMVLRERRRCAEIVRAAQARANADPSVRAVGLAGSALAAIESGEPAKLTDKRPGEVYEWPPRSER